MRYIVALVIAGIVIGASWLGANQAANALQMRFKQKMIKAQKEGHISADIDLNRDNLTDFGTEVSDDELLQIKLLDLLFGLSFFLIPATVGGAFLIAYLWPSSSKQHRARAAATNSEIK